MTGKFVTFEGCEGVGKTTQIRLIKDYCLQHNVDAIFTREPGGTDISEKIRDIILHDDSGKMSVVTETILYMAARAQHIEEIIAPALKQGKIVFCDRFFDSTYAYQGFGRGVDTDILKSINSFAASGLSPDLTLFLDVSPEAGFLRKGGRDSGDRLENMDIDFHKRVYEGFLSIKEPRFMRVSGGGGILETHEIIVNLLKEHNIL